jgi:hypothetical protein
MRNAKRYFDKYAASWDNKPVQGGAVRKFIIFLVTGRKKRH